jgi:hypothetical protein
VLYTIAATVGWVAWAYAAYLLGTRLLPGAGTRSDPGELLRTLGFPVYAATLALSLLLLGPWPS